MKVLVACEESQTVCKAFRECERQEICPGCPLNGDNCPIDEFSAVNLIKRLEALLAENERLREVTKMMPKWHFSTERPTMEKIEDPEDEWWESDRAIVVTSKGVLTDVSLLNYRHCPNCGARMDGGADNG